MLEWACYYGSLSIASRGAGLGGTGRWALPQGGLEILWPVAQHSYTKLTILKTKLCFTCGE